MSALFGQRNGVIGCWVAKTGFDILTCTQLQMSFSSDFAKLRKISSGTLSLGPCSQSSGASEAVANVPFDKTYSSFLPFVAAVAMASDWTLRLELRSNRTGNLIGVVTAGQYGYMNGVWTTPIFEWPSTQGLNGTYGHGISLGHNLDDNWFPGNNTWGSIKFDVRVFQSFAQFAICNQTTSALIKYAFFDPDL